MSGGATAFRHKHGPWISKLCSTSGHRVLRLLKGPLLVVFLNPSPLTAGSARDLDTECPRLGQGRRWVDEGRHNLQGRHHNQHLSPQARLPDQQTVAYKWTQGIQTPGGLCLKERRNTFGPSTKTVLGVISYRCVMSAHLAHRTRAGCYSSWRSAATWVVMREEVPLILHMMQTTLKTITQAMMTIGSPDSPTHRHAT
jgi:hypothetical protein